VSGLFSRSATLADGRRPFDTGDELFNASATFKRNAAYSGDATFHAPRRNFLDVAREQGHEETWSFLFDHVPAGIQLEPGQGGEWSIAGKWAALTTVFHGVDLNFTRGRPTEADAPWWNEEDVNLTKAIMEYW
jgi:hypothetical protein